MNSKLNTAGNIETISKWNAFLEEVGKQVQVYLFGLSFLFLFRIALILTFYNKVSPDTDFGQYAVAMAHGFRFDSAIAGLFVLLPFLTNYIVAPFGPNKISQKVRGLTTAIMLVAMPLFCVSTIPYFAEYDSQFNFFLFETLYDDQSAIIGTILEGHHPFRYISIFLVLSTLCFYLMSKWLKVDLSKFIPVSSPKNVFIRVIAVVLIFTLAFAACRGSFKSRPAMRKWSDISTDVFLNKTIMNPFKQLHYAFKDFNKLNSQSTDLSAYVGKASIQEVVSEYFELPDGEPVGDDLSVYIKRTVSHEDNKQPQHVFLVVMESYDAWPFLKDYESLAISNGLKDIGKEGVFFDHFLPAGDSTMSSLSTLLTGIPYSGTNISRIASRGNGTVTSTARIFKNLGYKTRFYYGGFLSWQNIGDLSTAQGFDEVYGAPNIKTNFSSDARGGLWGVEDEQLFNFALNKTKSEEKTFNIILTTSYHSPYSIDVYKKGFHLNEVPQDIEPIFDGTMDLNLLGHIWYGDREVGRFVKATEEKYPDSLFAMTGDHYGRRFLNARPSIYENSAVPFILYGKNYLPASSEINRTPGAHIDIVPTLVDLIAPKGFEYHTFGRALLNQDEQIPNKAGMEHGVGYQTIATKRFIVNWKLSGKPSLFPHSELEINKEDSKLFQKLKKRHNQLLGLGWWLLRKGEKLE